MYYSNASIPIVGGREHTDDPPCSTDHASAYHLEHLCGVWRRALPAQRGFADVDQSHFPDLGNRAVSLGFPACFIAALEASTHALTKDLYRSGLFSPYMIKLPAYLSSNSFRNPTDTNRTLFNYAASTNLGYFEWLQHQPEQLAAFSATMAASSDMGTKRAATTVSNLFPANLVANVLLVDVGGGKGKILEDVRKQRPDLKGKMIVQDLPQEIDDRETAEGVEVMVYDFFTPQPIKGTRPPLIDRPHPIYKRSCLENYVKRRYSRTGIEELTVYRGTYILLPPYLP